LLTTSVEIWNQLKGIIQLTYRYVHAFYSRYGVIQRPPSTQSVTTTYTKLTPVYTKRPTPQEHAENLLSRSIWSRAHGARKAAAYLEHLEQSKWRK